MNKFLCSVFTGFSLALCVPLTAESSSKNVLLDDEHVEVVRLVYPVGASSGVHSHAYPARTVYVLQGGEIEIEAEDGQLKSLSLAEGTVFKMPAATHNIRNVGATDVQLLEQELKFAVPQVSVSDTVDELTRMLKDFLEGVERAEVHNAFWAHDLVYTSSRGTRTNKAGIMAGFDAPADDKAPEGPVYTAEDIDIRVYGDTAVMAFVLVAKTPDEMSYYLNTGTLLKRQGVWQVVAWQATVKE